MAPLVEMEEVFMEEAEVEVTSTIVVEVKEVLTMVTEAIMKAEVTVEVEVDHTQLKDNPTKWVQRTINRHL